MLDSQTTLIISVLIFALLPVLIRWLAPAESTDAPTGWWQLGSLAAALGLGLLAWRLHLPVWMAAHMSNTCLLLSLLLWMQSLRSHLGQGWTTGHVLWGGLLALGFYSLTYSTLSIPLRVAANRVALGALALGVAHLAWQLARRDRSANAMAIMACYVLLGLGLWTSIPLVMLSNVPVSIQGIVLEVPGSPAVLTLVTATVGNFCYLGMLLELSMHRKQKAMREHVIAQENARLDAQLQRMDRQRRLVLAAGSLAHELNQPLTAALTQTQLAQRMLRLPTVSQNALTDMLDKASQSIWRTSDILNRIRGATHASAFIASRLDLRKVVQSTCELMAPECRELGVHLHTELPGTALWCQADEILLSQVLVNLIRNACQALRESPHKRIEIQAARKGSDMVLSVRDHGPGLPTRVLERWGEPFIDSSEKGLGLGLAISRAIVHQFEGQLHLFNHPDGGAQVRLRLPMARESAP